MVCSNKQLKILGIFAEFYNKYLTQKACSNWIFHSGKSRSRHVALYPVVPNLSGNSHRHSASPLRTSLLTHAARWSPPFRRELKPQLARYLLVLTFFHFIACRGPSPSSRLRRLNPSTRRRSSYGNFIWLAPFSSPLPPLPFAPDLTS